MNSNKDLNKSREPKEFVHLKSYRSPKIKVRGGSIVGKGIFAIRPIKKDEIVAIKGGHIVNTKTLTASMEVSNHSELQIADDFFVTNMNENELEDVMIFYNHSCEPNIGYMGNIICVAMRDITVGEEIVNDYAMWENREGQFECLCGTKTCRKIVTGKDWMHKDLQDKYGNYFQAYLLAKIKSLK